MSWDDNKNNNDPWNNQRNPDTPPNLDAILKDWQNKLNKLLGGKASSDNNGSTWSFLLMSLLLLALWGASGIFIIAPAEEGVVTRFGRYTETKGPGLHWAPRFVDRVYKVDIANVLDFSYRSSMLTQDENIVSVEVAVQYRIANPEEFLFRVDSPIVSLQQATASALRFVIGHTNLTEILTTGREVVRQKVRAQLEQILSRYDTGLILLDVVMQPATPPEEVKDAFDDAIKAQEDEQRYKNQAEAYEKAVVPAAKGKAERIVQAATAYGKQKVLLAQGDVARFAALLPKYKQSPKVTKERLYLDTMESVLSNTTKVLMPDGDSNQLMYLPIDKLISNAAPKKATEKNQDNADDQSWSNEHQANHDDRNDTERYSSRRGY